MSCPLCGSQIVRYFHYSRATTHEGGQFQFRLFSEETLLLDYHIKREGINIPLDRNYETIQLGSGDDLEDLVQLASHFPLYMENLKQNEKMVFDGISDTAKFVPEHGGLILRYQKQEPFDRVVFSDVNTQREFFSLPESVFHNEMTNALIELQHAVDAVDAWKADRAKSSTAT